MLAVNERFGEYVVEGTLGKGGMATVFAVRHGPSGAPFALKVLHTPTPADLVRFEREAAVQGRLRHPNIVGVRRVLQHEGRPALLMDRVTGGTLKQLLKERGRLSNRMLDPLAAGILSGLAAAHAKGLVHRDLKPANILLGSEDGMPVARITDFGLVRVLEEGSQRLTDDDITLGTPLYMAPEQLTGARNADQRADVYSVGCILYEMATGRPPIERGTLVEIFERITSGSRRPVQALAPELPRRMQRCIERCLAVDPAARFADGGALREAWLGFDAHVASPLPPPDDDTMANDETVRVHPEARDALLAELDANTNRWTETTRIFGKLTRPEGRRELVDGVEARLPTGRSPGQQRLIRALAVLVVFGITTLAGVLAGLVIVVLLAAMPLALGG